MKSKNRVYSQSVQMSNMVFWNNVNLAISVASHGDLECTYVHTVQKYGNFVIASRSCDAEPAGFYFECKASLIPWFVSVCIVSWLKLTKVVVHTGWVPSNQKNKFNFYALIFRSKQFFLYYFHIAFIQIIIILFSTFFSKQLKW